MIPDEHARDDRRASCAAGSIRPVCPQPLVRLKPLLVLVFAGALIYLALIGLLWVFQRNLIYLPGMAGPSPAAAGVAGMREVRVETADGLHLLAWYRAPVVAEGLTVLYLHGNAGSLAARAFKVQPLLAAGHGVLLLSWRGYGDNPGAPTEAGLYSDARAAIDYLAEEGVETGRIALYGESLGSAVAVQMAVEHRFDGLILEAPLSSLADVAATHYPFVPVRALLKDRYDSASKIASVAAPVLILHGLKDRVVPFRYGEKLYAAAAEPKRLIAFPEGGHENLHALGAGSAVLEFLEELGGGTPFSRRR